MSAKELIREIEKSLMSEPLFIDYFSKFEEIGSRAYTERNNGENFEILEIRGQSSESKLSKFLMLKLYATENNLVITNILIPGAMRRKGFGMKILSIIYSLAKNKNYVFFITDMVQSFYEKMLKKGAHPTNEETVEITEETQLYFN